MSLLSQITEETNVEEVKDSLGGFQRLESGLYTFIVDTPYLEKTVKGAVLLKATLKSGDDTLNITETIASSDEKGNKTTYERNGKTFFLPGFTLVNDMCLLATGSFDGEAFQFGKGILQQTTETKVVKVWNFEAQKELPEEREVLTGLHGKSIIAGVIKRTENKQQRTDSGVYVDLPETREVNVIDKMFHPDARQTVTEIKAELESPDFINQWEDKNKGKTQDRTKKSVQGSTPTGTTEGKPTRSLFANK